MTLEQLKTLVDNLFAYIEDKESGHPFVVAVLKVVNQTIDVAGLPALLNYLKSVGLATTDIGIPRSQLQQYIDALFSYVEIRASVLKPILQVLNVTIDTAGLDALAAWLTAHGVNIIN